MALNGLDYFIVLVLAGSAWRGYRRGLIKTAGSIIAVLAGIIVAGLYRIGMANYLQTHFSMQAVLAEKIKQYISAQTTAMIPFYDSSLNLFSEPSQYLARMLTLAIAFLILFFIVILAVNSIFGLLQKAFSLMGLNGINRCGGIIFSLLKDMIIISIILGMLVPVMKTGAVFGWDKAYMIVSLVEKSVLAGSLVKAYAFLAVLIGFNV
jgi:uncharacterized membrane protein required for colicin V production